MLQVCIVLRPWATVLCNWTSNRHVPISTNRHFTIKRVLGLELTKHIICHTSLNKNVTKMGIEITLHFVGEGVTINLNDTLPVINQSPVKRVITAAIERNLYSFRILAKKHIHIEPLNKQLKKQSGWWWFETPSRSCVVTVTMQNFQSNISSYFFIFIYISLDILLKFNSNSTSVLA